MPGQLTQLKDMLARAQRVQPDRKLDLVYLTIGANDINFSGLVADVIIEAGPERGAVPARRHRRQPGRGAVDAGAQAAVGLRAAARGAEAAVVGNLEKVVYVPYGNPACGRAAAPAPARATASTSIRLSASTADA